MPEDVLEEPVTHQVISNIKIPNLSDAAKSAIVEKQGFTHQILWEDVVRNANTVVVNLKKRHPDIDELRIEAVADLLFGPFRIDRKALGETSNEEEKEMNARVQHNLTHGIIYAGNSEADPAYTFSMYSIAQTMEKMADSSPGKIVGLSSYWNGIKSEIAVVRTFIRNGYQVVLPDYTQDLYETEPEKNEVLQWDIRNGIDFIAKKDDHMFLVDAKGRWSMEGKFIRTIPHVNHQRISVKNIPSDILSSYSDLFKKERVGKIEVRIPVLKPFLSGLPKFTETTNRRKALSQFANSQVEDDIMMRVRQEIDKMPK